MSQVHAKHEHNTQVYGKFNCTCEDLDCPSLNEQKMTGLLSKEFSAGKLINNNNNKNKTNKTC